MSVCSVGPYSLGQLFRSTRRIRLGLIFSTPASANSVRNQGLFSPHSNWPMYVRWQLPLDSEG